MFPFLSQTIKSIIYSFQYKTVDIDAEDLSKPGRNFYDIILEQRVVPLDELPRSHTNIYNRSRDEVIEYLKERIKNRRGTKELFSFGYHLSIKYPYDATVLRLIQMMVRFSSNILGMMLFIKVTCDADKNLFKHPGGDPRHYNLLLERIDYYFASLTDFVRDVRLANDCYEMLLELEKTYNNTDIFDHDLFHCYKPDTLTFLIGYLDWCCEKKAFSRKKLNKYVRKIRSNNTPSWFYKKGNRSTYTTAGEEFHERKEPNIKKDLNDLSYILAKEQGSGPFLGYFFQKGNYYRVDWSTGEWNAIKMSKAQELEYFILHQPRKDILIELEEYFNPRYFGKKKREIELYKAVRDYFQDSNAIVLSNIKPSFLGGRLELDIYVKTSRPKKKIGIEYQGKQHFESMDVFGGPDAFEKLNERDRRKRVLCKENNVELIYFNYDDEMSHEMIESKLSKFICK